MAQPHLGGDVKALRHFLEKPEGSTCELEPHRGVAGEKQRLIREELYADAELVKDEMESLRTEVSALEVELDTTGLEDDIRDIEDGLAGANSGEPLQAAV